MQTTMVQYFTASNSGEPPYPRFLDKTNFLRILTPRARYPQELFCLLFGPPGFNCWFSFAPVFQWCCSTPQGSPGVGRNALFLSSPHLCFIIVFICDLFVSRDDPLMCKKTFTRTEQLYVLSHDRSRGRGWDPVKPV